MRKVLGWFPWRSLPKPSPAMSVALLALLIAAGGVAVAAIPSENGTINGCYNPKNGSLRVIDFNQSCSKGETALTLASADATTGKVANADKLDGLDSADFAPAGGPECPSGTQEFVGLCIDEQPRPSAAFGDASSTCASLSGRLPTGAELDAFRQQEGIVLGGQFSQFEWTGEIIRHRDTLEDGYQPETLVMSDEGLYHRGSHHPTVTLPFRCVQ